MRRWERCSSAACCRSHRSRWRLQYWMNRLIGPILILVGMFLLDLLRFNFSTSLVSSSLQDRAQHWGTWGAGLLGMIFALTFCPVSAALFFREPDTPLAEGGFPDRPAGPVRHRDRTAGGAVCDRAGCRGPVTKRRAEQARRNRAMGAACHWSGFYCRRPLLHVRSHSRVVLTELFQEARHPVEGVTVRTRPLSARAFVTASILRN